MADGSAWRPPERWGEPLLVTDPDARGGRINGVRRRWETLIPRERRRLVTPGGGSCLLAVKSGGGPFTAWPSVFERTANRIRARFEPRFPHVHPHRLRHSMAMQALEYLVTGHYRQAAKLVRDTGAEPALFRGLGGWSGRGRGGFPGGLGRCLPRRCLLRGRRDGLGQRGQVDN